MIVGGIVSIFIAKLPHGCFSTRPRPRGGAPRSLGGPGRRGVGSEGSQGVGLGGKAAPPSGKLASPRGPSRRPPPVRSRSS